MTTITRLTNSMTRKKITDATPPARVTLGRSRTPIPTPNGITTNGNGGNVPEKYAEPEPEFEISHGEALSLFNLVERTSGGSPEDQDLSCLLKSIKMPPQKCFPHRSLMSAFNRSSSSSISDSNTLLNKSNISNTTPNDEEDDCQLRQLSDLIRSPNSMAYSSMQAAFNIFKNYKQLTTYDIKGAEYFDLIDDWLNKGGDYRYAKIQVEKESAIETDLTDSVFDYFDRISPLVEKFLAISTPQSLKIVLSKEKPKGLPCPIEERQEIVQILKRLGRLLEEIETDCRIDNFEKRIHNCVENHVDDLNRDIKHLKLTLDNLSQDLEFTTKYRHYRPTNTRTQRD